MKLDETARYKAIQVMESKFEAATGIRLLIAYQCIYCGKVFDDINQCSEHGIFCYNKKNLVDNKEELRKNV